MAFSAISTSISLDKRYFLVSAIVLRLNETESIKVYSPERAMFAQQAMYNAEKLLGLGFLVPKPKEFVRINLCYGAKLPKFDYKHGLRLDSVSGSVRSVPAVIKEYFDGDGFGTIKPTFDQLKKLRSYLDRLDENDLSFYEGINLDYIALKDGRVGLVDCTTLVSRENFDPLNGKFDYFDEAVSSYEGIVLDSLKQELRNNGHLDFSTHAKLFALSLYRTFKS